MKTKLHTKMNVVSLLPLAMILVLGLWTPIPAQSAEPAKKKMMMKDKAMEGCKAMMKKKQKMMKEMKAQDAKLTKLVANIKEASGDKKINLMATVLDKMVAQRTARNQRKTKMREDMMRHMMSHMKKGKESMSKCPMMKASGNESDAASGRPEKQNKHNEGNPDSPTDVLKKEHHLIKKMAGLAGTTATRIRESEAVDLDEVNQLHDFFKHFADECHHAKEEDLLFPRLKTLEVDPVTINLLIKQHQEGRILLGGIATILDKSEGSLSNADRKGLAEYLLQYSQLMDRHIKLENDYLWPRAAQALDKEAKDALTKEFKGVEIGLGEGFHQKYHAMAMKLLNESGDG